MCSYFILFVAIMIAPRQAAPLLNPTNPLTDSTARQWHDNELKQNLACLFGCGNPTEYMSFSEYFPNKAAGFVITQEDGYGETDSYDADGFSTIITKMQDQLRDYSDYVTLDLTHIAFESFSTNGDGNYEIVSKQKVSFDILSYKGDLDQQEVTYVFDPQTLYLVAVRQVSLESGSTVRAAIAALKIHRRRLMDHESVKSLMALPNLVRIPLGLLCVVLLVFMSLMFLWKTMCYCGAILRMFGRRRTMKNRGDVETINV